MRPTVHIARVLSTLAIFLLALSCTSDDGGDAIQLTSKSAVELYPVEGQEAQVTFTASGSWTATCHADWLLVSPQKGEAGSQTLTLHTLTTNRTGQSRTAQLMINCGSSYKNITVVQTGQYAVFTQEIYTVGPEGGTLTIPFSTNLEEADELKVGYGQQSWIGFADASRTTRAVWKGELPELKIDANTTAADRTAAFYLVLSLSDDQWLGLDTCYVRQTGVADDYESTDFSADGKVTLLQQSTQGKGINIVMMGDGFDDLDIADGTYEKVMAKSMENMFSEEPVKSLRNYFNVYAVTAVSVNGKIGSDYSTVFSTVPSISSSNIACDDETVEKYVYKVGHLDMDRTLAVVILNSHVHNGVTYLYGKSDGTPLQYAVALCPVIDSLESETFRQVLTHEAIGHGLAKLADEYGYTSNGTATTEVVESIEKYHGYGWFLNVDGNNDMTKVAWRDFIGVSQYDNEYIGVYEGGYTYTTGIYRPTEESMMNSNQSPFNAPSRKAIYDKVMALGEGQSTSTMEAFSIYDAAHQPTEWNYATTRSIIAQRRFAAPIMKKR